MVRLHIEGWTQGDLCFSLNSLAQRQIQIKRRATLDVMLLFCLVRTRREHTCSGIEDSEQGHGCSCARTRPPYPRTRHPSPPPAEESDDNEW